MVEDVKILTARRSYEFGPDDLRLTMLTTAPVQSQVQATFGFQTFAVAAPMPTFGPVPGTIPPGIAFDAGYWVTPESQIIPIRFIHIEQRRIVIDVAAPSAIIDAIFAKFREVIAPFVAPDGSRLLGEVQQTADYSEITTRFTVGMAAMFKPSVHRIINAQLSMQGPREPLDLVPSLFFRAYPADREYPGLQLPPDYLTLQLAVRAGSRPDEHVFFSAGPFDTESHLGFLRRIEAALTA